MYASMYCHPLTDQSVNDRIDTIFLTYIYFMHCFFFYNLFFYFLLSHYTYNTLHIYLAGQCQSLPISITKHCHTVYILCNVISRSLLYRRNDTTLTDLKVSLFHSNVNICVPDKLQRSPLKS